MKITWDNIDNFKITKYGNFKYNGNAYYLIEDGCKCCGDPYFVQRWIYKKGKGRFCSHSCSMTGEFNSMYMINKDNAPCWRGGVKQLKLTSYDTYQSQLEPYGIECRRNEENTYLLEVKCMYCGKWYKPSNKSVRCKINAINGKSQGELNLYCSDKCKKACPTYNQKKYPKDYKLNTSREVQPELRKLVLRRDNYTCQKCDATNVELHCHHYEGVEVNPIESADIDQCITLCKECHNEVHKKDKCGMKDYKRGICNDKH
jgi:5-methylcytosine-specific restriction endonuclease McrA